MGGIASTLRTSYLNIRVVLADLATANKDFNALLTRLNNPILPIPNPSTSYWQQHPPFPELVDIKSPALPSSADIVIIGSGISGASIAYTLLTQTQDQSATREPCRVVLFEARNICSGATGRNGGHIKCATYADYASFKSRFGRERARKMLEFERRALPLLVGFAETEGLARAEAREVETVDVITDAGMWEKTKEMVRDLKVDVPDAGEEVEVFERELGCEKFGLDPGQCYGVVRYRAGALWPYRFVTSLYARLLSEFGSRFSIETNTPATGIETREGSGMPFVVSTPRGEIRASHVIHATDASVANLVPGTIAKIFPMRGHMTAQTPGDGLPYLDGSRSWSIMGRRGFDYITQRPGRPGDSEDGLGGELMVGGGVVQSPGQGIDEFGVWRDDQMSGPISAYLDGIMPVIFGRERWGQDSHGTRIKQAWTGCMGFTADLLPYVGKLEPGLTGRGVTYRPGSATGVEQDQVPPGEWISAGFNGEGMVLAWLCGVAVGLMALGLDDKKHDGCVGIPPGTVKDWLPEEFICSKRRVDRSDVTELGLLL
ncbi:nucleotide-binding domain-containing protein [Aspergillus ellipticus CBS 707.79]|uniref:Nucleotide-binding domain-containing protein n=1 Tax=Aspergillus ellipticus CBS 707.79 TaxID=1448320 RepID=A0A319DBR8_9EURO|nr:nucleotide-binding domain-containing protein [Aspergillus ellipticus CBS 707.79]